MSQIITATELRVNDPWLWIAMSPSPRLGKKRYDDDGGDLDEEFDEESNDEDEDDDRDDDADNNSDFDDDDDDAAYDHVTRTL
jgi:hypothetical protein